MQLFEIGQLPAVPCRLLQVMYLRLLFAAFALRYLDEVPSLTSFNSVREHSSLKFPLDTSALKCYSIPIKTVERV